MRITLVHNPKAGRGKLAKKDLMAALAKAGHQAIYQSTRKSDYKKALKKSVDVVLAAGGDGTVGKVGRELIDSGIPLGVLPLGTANNLARSLVFTASPEEIVAGLAGSRHRDGQLIQTAAIFWREITGEKCYNIVTNQHQR